MRTKTTADGSLPFRPRSLMSEAIQKASGRREFYQLETLWPEGRSVMMRFAAHVGPDIPGRVSDTMLTDAFIAVRERIRNGDTFHHRRRTLVEAVEAGLAYVPELFRMDIRDGDGVAWQPDERSYLNWRTDHEPAVIRSIPDATPDPGRTETVRRVILDEVADRWPGPTL